MTGVSESSGVLEHGRRPKAPPRPALLPRLTLAAFEVCETVGLGLVGGGVGGGGGQHALKPWSSSGLRGLGSRARTVGAEGVRSGELHKVQKRIGEAAPEMKAHLGA